MEPQTRLSIGQQAMRSIAERRIYCELELIFRIRPRKRLQRYAPKLVDELCMQAAQAGNFDQA